METALVAQAVNFEELAIGKGIDLNYELTSGFATRYIRRKSRQLVGKLRFSAAEQDELEQDLRILILKRLPKFDPAKSHWNAFVTTVVERRVATILESRRAMKREHTQNLTSLSVQVQDEEGQLVELSQMIDCDQKLTGCVSRPPQDQADLAHDVAAVVASLPPEFRDLCERLKHNTCSDVARDLGIAQSSLIYRLWPVRYVFQEAGLKSFLRPTSVKSPANPVGKE